MKKEKEKMKEGGTRPSTEGMVDRYGWTADEIRKCTTYCDICPATIYWHPADEVVDCPGCGAEYIIFECRGCTCTNFDPTYSFHKNCAGHKLIRIIPGPYPIPSSPPRHSETGVHVEFRKKEDWDDQ